jgi:hypothetical protein
MDVGTPRAHLDSKSVAASEKSRQKSRPRAERPIANPASSLRARQDSNLRPTAPENERPISAIETEQISRAKPCTDGPGNVPVPGLSHPVLAAVEDAQVCDLSSAVPALSRSTPSAVGAADAAESALAEALVRASRDGNLDLAMACVAELRERRLARESAGAGHVIDLDVERHRRQ